MSDIRGMMHLEDVHRVDFLGNPLGRNLINPACEQMRFASTGNGVMPRVSLKIYAHKEINAEALFNCGI